MSFREEGIKRDVSKLLSPEDAKELVEQAHRDAETERRFRESLRKKHA